MTDRALPDLSAALAHFVADATVDEAARSRARERSLWQQASEDASFVGVLLDLAERGRPIVLSASGGRRHRGVVRTVAMDFCILRTDTGTDQLVSYQALGMIRPLPQEAETVGDRPATLDLDLGDALTHLSDDRPRLRIGLIGDPEPHIGELRSVGRDVITLRMDGDPPPTAYLQVALIAEVAIAR
ncbi:MAG: hypothetical protein ACERLM_08965 [Acidimicrobiales bacterium]